MVGLGRRATVVAAFIARLCNEVVIFSERPLISASDHDMIARIQPDFSTSDWRPVAGRAP